MPPSPFDRSLPHDIREALFGGTGCVRVWNVVPTPIAPFRAVLACELDPASSVGTHRQEFLPELVVGIAGTGIAYIHGEPHALTPGSVVELPLGATLSIRNTAVDAPLRYLILKAGTIET